MRAGEMQNPTKQSHARARARTHLFILLNLIEKHK